MTIIQCKKLGVAAACLVFLCMATTASAENNRAGAFTVSPFAGKFLFDKHTDYDDDLIFGLGLGYNLTKNIAAELSYGRVNTDRLDNGGNEVDGAFDLYRLEGLYHFTNICPKGGFVPFLAIGAGMASFDAVPGRTGRDNDFAADYGAGFKYFVNPDVALRADVRHLLNFKGSDEEYDSNWFYTFGLTVLFGGEKAAAPAAVVAPAEEPAPAPAPVAPEPVDSDNDGVTDDLDKCPNTAAGTKVDSQGCPATEKAVVTEEGTMSFGIIYFDTAKSTIKPQSRPVLQDVADYLKKYPEVKLEVQGHTDSVGTDAFNQKLSEARATAVRNYLIGQGIAGDRLTTEGFGESKPAASNATKEGRAKNRRIEFMPIQ